MPELPDLAVMAKNIEKRLKDHTLEALTLHIDRKASVDEKTFQNALVGHKVKSVYREGKELRFEIGKEILGLHLMLHGELKIVEKDEEVKFPILQLDFGKDHLYLTDWQKQAAATLNPGKTTVPDALEIKGKEFAELLNKKKRDIKTVLLDQKSIRGIGNAYADEILYDSRISPHSIANAIPANQVENLWRSMQTVLKDAIDQISKADPDRLTGENRDFMKVHLSKTDKTTKGETIIVEKKGSRKSYFVESQKLYK